MYVINSIYFVPGSRHHQELQGLLRELARDDGEMETQLSDLKSQRRKPTAGQGYEDCLNNIKED